MIMVAAARARGRRQESRSATARSDLFLEQLKARAARAPNSTSRTSWCACPSRRARSASGGARPRREGARRGARRRATSRRSRRATPMRPTRCRAARSAGARTSGCRSSSPTRWRSMQPGEVSDVAAQPGRLPHPQAARQARRGAREAPVRADARAPHPDPHQRGGLGERGAPPARSTCASASSRAARTSPSSRACTPTTARAARGGELGWVSPGDTVPEFERAYAAS